MISAITMTYADEAIGIARAAAAVEPAGGDLVHRRDRRPAAVGPAARRGDRPASTTATDVAPAYYMVNCAHPTHFLDHARRRRRPGPTRIKGLRANASRLSHAELDDADGTRPGRHRRARRLCTPTCSDAHRPAGGRRLLRHRRRARRRHRHRARARRQRSDRARRSVHHDVCRIIPYADSGASSSCHSTPGLPCSSRSRRSSVTTSTSGSTPTGVPTRLRRYGPRSTPTTRGSPSPMTTSRASSMSPSTRPSTPVRST